MFLERLLKVFVITLLLAFSANMSLAEGIKILNVKEYLEQVEATTQGERYFIDVRTAEEYAEGTILDADNIDVLNSTFIEEVAKLDREKPVYLFCRSGNRSQKAAEMMSKMGFTNIIDLDGGYQSWSLFNAEQSK